MSMGKTVDLAANSVLNTSTNRLERGGKYAFFAEGTFGGGSVKLQSKSRNGTFVDVAGGSLSAAGMATLDLPPGEFQVVITTATAVYAYLIPAF